MVILKFIMVDLKILKARNSDTSASVTLQEHLFIL